MATNPMQRKTRNAFFLGVVAMLLIAAIVVALLYVKISNQNKEINKYKLETAMVYILNQDVESGQILTADMFTMKSVPRVTIPADAEGIANQTVGEVFAQRSFCDTNGNYIYFSGEKYFVNVNGTQRDVYKIGANGDQEVAKTLTLNDKAYYYTGQNNTGRVDITVATNAIVSKIKLQANTIITTSMIARASDVTTDDLREQEYNVISLPVDLMSGEYVDIRLMLPNGQDYVVASKKQVTVPVVNGQYLADTIKVKMTEKDILTVSSAIVENYQIEGSKLYATKYAEAGVQNVAAVTYRPTDEVVDLINRDENIVNKAINGLRDRINDAKNRFGNEDNITKKTEESATSALEARQQYLQSLGGAN